MFRLLEQEEKVLLLTQLQSGAAIREKVLVTTTTHIFRPQDEFLAMNENSYRKSGQQDIGR